tara:strand:- start:632 stop:2362 length:1731 start_codon:yes stop_codon:yes gene_type:complete
MAWKKVIVSGSVASLSEVSASVGFKGNLVGAVTGNATTATTATQVGNSLTVDDSTIQLNSGTTYDGAAARTISVKNSGITLAKIANQANNTVLGNVSGGAAAPSALTATNIRTLISVEEDADVTDATNVAAAGALMDSELAEIATVKALTKAGISGSLSSTALAALGAGLVSSSAQVSALGGVQDSTITITAGNGLSGGGSFTVNTGSNGSISLAVGVDDSTIELNSDALRIKDSGVTLAKIANQANNTILGNVSGGAAAPSALTAANVRTLINVEDGADVTDATNVTSAGALMDSEVGDLALVKGLSKAGISGSFGAASASFSTRVTANDAKLTANTSNVTTAGALMDSEVTNLAFVKSLTGGIAEGNVAQFTAAVADNDFLRIDGTEVEGLSATEVRTALNVEDGADVTDTTNVTAAGALMDSELTSLSDVKAIDQGLTTTSNVTFNNVIATGNLDVQGTTTTLNTTNLNVEDQFILVNSGSNSKDAGIIFGGTGGTNQQGKALIWDYSFNSNDGRLAVSTTDVAWNNTTNFAGGTAGYYVAGVFIGSLEDAATAKADHRGNIRITSGEIFIYV